MRRFTFLLGVFAIGCAPAQDSAVTKTASGPRYFGATRAPARDVFTFANGAEPEGLDPGLISGQPDGRVARAMFEGLAIPDPITLEPTPGHAYRWEISSDGLSYTFHLRPGLKWSDGSPLTAQDFLWSWRRAIRPETASRNANLLYPILNAEAFNKGEITDITTVGMSAPDDSTFVVRLTSPTSYFLFLTQYYTFLPVPRAVIEAHGPRWTRPENVISNGPFVLEKWRQGDRFEFKRNPLYWDAASVKLERVVMLSVDDLNTCANLYKAGVTDWNPSGYLPSQFIPHLKPFADLKSGPYHGIYFYSINTTRKPFDNVWVRRALAYAVDREAIAQDLLKGIRPAWGNFTPMGYPGYRQPPPMKYDPERARECLARAGFPGGRGFPRVSILFNTSEDHRRVAEAVQAMWKRELGIRVELANQEWGSYLQATTTLQYDVARRAWIGDYLDPTTFLGIMRTGDGNNRTGFSDPGYDALLRRAARELDSGRRFEILAEAESLMLEQAPVIPIYHYATTELVKPYVRGLHSTALDTHPLKYVWIDRDWRRRPAVAAR